MGDGAYLGVKRLEDGTYAMFVRLAFTHAICLGASLDEPYTRRFCFSNMVEALVQYDQLKRIDDEPEGWVARRPALG